MLLGTKFGTILNKTFNSLFLTIVLCIMMCYSLNSTWRNMRKAQKREKMKDEEFNKELITPIYETKGEKMIELQTVTYGKSDFDEQRELLIRKMKEKDNDPIPMEKIKIILLLECLVIVDQIIEGNSKVPSLLGIPKCSGVYWLVFVIYCGVSLFLINYIINSIQKEFEYKKSIAPDMKMDKLIYIQNNKVRIVILTIFAGIISSMVGIGGGMITNPIFLGMGLDPKATASSSTFLIMTTALASSFIYLISGQLNIEFAICIAIPCVLSAYFGSQKILLYMNRTGKSSILLLIMVWFLIISMVVTLFKAYFDIKESNDFNIFRLKPYC